METKLIAKKIGGSIGIIIPKNVVELERIAVNDILKIKIEKTGDLSFLWGKLKNVRKTTDKIMAEMDEWENE